MPHQFIIFLSFFVDDYFSDWLEAESYAVKCTEHPIYFLSRQDQKVKRVKHRLENYMFVTDNTVNFTVAEFKTMLSVHLNLTYDFQLLEVEQNRLES